jgi:hypothetical protein
MIVAKFTLKLNKIFVCMCNFKMAWIYWSIHLEFWISSVARKTGEISVQNGENVY